MLEKIVWAVFGYLYSGFLLFAGWQDLECEPNPKWSLLAIIFWPITCIWAICKIIERKGRGDS